MKQKRCVFTFLGICAFFSMWSQQLSENFEEDTAPTCEEQVVAAENYFRGAETILKDTAKGMELLQPCLEQGYSKAQHLYGLLHIGAYKAIPRDYKVGFEYIEKAALQGNADAMCNLAILHKMGRGTKIDFDKAIEFHQQAYEFGSTKSAFKLGYLYFKGLGSIDQDYEKAVEWFNKSEYPRTDFFLGICYYYGYGVAVDKDRALAILSASDTPGCERLFDSLLTDDHVILTEEEISTSKEIQTQLEQTEQVVEADIEEQEEAFDIKTVAGDWEGKLIEFDWSNTKLLRTAPANVSLTVDSKTNNVDFAFTIAGSTSDDTPVVLDNSLSFTKLEMTLERLYKDANGYDFLKYKINSADITQKSIAGEKYLVINIGTQITNWKEPGPPMQLILKSKTYSEGEGTNKEEISEELLKLLAEDNNGFISLYPNPFVEDLLIEYELEEVSTVTVEIYNYLDQSRVVLEAGKLQQPDKYTYYLDGYNLKTGLYIVRVTANQQVHTRMIVKGN